MHVHDPGLVSISVGVFSAAAGRRLPVRPGAIAADTPVVWIGQSPADDESQVVLASLAGGESRAYEAVIEEVSERLFRCDLDSPSGKAALMRLTQGAPSDSARATPLGAFAEYVKDAPSAADARMKCEALIDGA